MDIILNLWEEHIFKPYFYPANFPLGEDSPLRQFLSLNILVNVGGFALYFFAAGLSYIFIFDKRLKKHPLFLKNQVRREIQLSCMSLPFMSFLTSFFFLLEMYYSKLYEGTETLWSVTLSCTSFVLFTDCLIYWIHRGLHTKHAYKLLHKFHHTWKIPTPFASHAFHPLDGFLQSFPYHLYTFLFPMNKYIYLGMFIMVNFWTVSIHDGDFRVPFIFKGVINGSAHHVDHHLFYNFNYGQFFTLWDRLGGSFRYPSAFKKDSPLDQILKGQYCSTKKNIKEKVL